MLGDAQGVALVALGGYGRRELCPFSDLDVVLLHRGGRDVDSLAQQLWYPIWDERLRLDHSVRTVKDAARMAENDLRTGLTMLDGRRVAGEPDLRGRAGAARRSVHDQAGPAVDGQPR